MFTKKVDLTVTKKEFLFSDGQRESRFRPVAYLTSDTKKILAVGNAPTEAAGYLTVDVFGKRDSAVDAFDVLESLMRYGLRSISPGIISRAPSIGLTIGEDIRADLKGFAPAIFRAALTNAGAAKVEIHEYPA